MKTELDSPDSPPIDGSATATDTSAQASTHTSARMSGRGLRIEVITGAERRRRWCGCGRHWSTIATLIVSSKLNDVEPLAWLTDVLQPVVSGRTKSHQLDALLP
jgi:IS66 C-terminal element